MFARSQDLVAECDLTFLHVFPYSKRPGTPAARMPQVGDKGAARLRPWATGFWGASKLSRWVHRVLTEGARSGDRLRRVGFRADQPEGAILRSGSRARTERGCWRDLSADVLEDTQSNSLIIFVNISQPLPCASSLGGRSEGEEGWASGNPGFMGCGAGWGGLGIGADAQVPFCLASRVKNANRLGVGGVAPKPPEDNLGQCERGLVARGAGRRVRGEPRLRVTMSARRRWLSTAFSWRAGSGPVVADQTAPLPSVNETPPLVAARGRGGDGWRWVPLKDHLAPPFGEVIRMRSGGDGPA
jgi:hypothetical protein